MLPSLRRLWSSPRTLLVVLGGVAFIALGAWVVGVHPAEAQVALLPACAESGDCSLCDVVGLFINFGSLMVQWLGVLAVLLFIIGGVFIIISAGNPDRVKRGRQIIGGTIIGTLLVVSAWMIVNFSLAALLDVDFDEVQLFPVSGEGGASGEPWYEIACTPVYQDCADADDGSACSTAACGKNCVCYQTSCVSYCEFNKSVGTFSDAVCKTSASSCPTTSSGSSYPSVTGWCPLNEAGAEQVCCYNP